MPWGETGWEGSSHRNHKPQIPWVTPRHSYCSVHHASLGAPETLFTYRYVWRHGQLGRSHFPSQHLALHLTHLTHTTSSHFWPHSHFLPHSAAQSALSVEGQPSGPISHNHFHTLLASASCFLPSLPSSLSATVPSDQVCSQLWSHFPVPLPHLWAGGRVLRILQVLFWLVGLKLSEPQFSLYKMKMTFQISFASSI